MSLFPAYNDQDEDSPPKTNPESWLSNPSFSSSIPTTSSTSSCLNKFTSSSSSSESEDEGYKRRRRRKKDRKKRRKRRRARSSSSSSSSSNSSVNISREEIIAKCNKKKTFIEETGLAPEHAFRYDTSATKALIKVRELPLKSLYHLHSHRTKTPKPLKESPRFYEKKYLKKFLKEQPSLLKPSSSFATAEYIRFKDSQPSLEKHDPLGIYDVSTVEYLSSVKIESIKKDEDTSNEEIVLSEAQKRIKYFNEHLRDHPGDEGAWMAYVDFQDEAFEASSHAEESTNKKDAGKQSQRVIRSRAIIEKKLAILQTALDKNPKSSVLAVRRLEISKDILDTSTLNRQWKELLYLFPTDFSLWKEYLGFKLAHFTSFSMSGVLEVFKSLFRKIEDLSEDMNRPPNLEDIFLDFFVTLVYFLRSAGFGEKSVASWQAMIEFNWFTPPIPGSYSMDDRRALFEPFWESGLPRIGENGALGWSTTRKNKDFSRDGVFASSTDWEDDLLAKSSARRSNLWLAIELGRTQKNWIPWRRSLDGEDDIEDPDRKVTFEDISPYLYNLVAINSKVKLLFIFLEYMMGMEEVSHLHRETSLLDAGFSPHTLKSDFAWLPVQKTDPVLKDIFTHNFLRNTFTQILEVIEDKPLRMQFAVLWIRFEANRILENIGEESSHKKSAEALIQKTLAKYPSDVNLYLAYADFVFKTGGGYKSASKVYKKCLAATGFDPYVYHAAIEFELSIATSNGGGDMKPSLWLLILSASEKAYRKAEENDDLKALALRAKHQVSQKLSSKTSIHPHCVCPENNGSLDRTYVYLWLIYLSEGIEYFERGAELAESLQPDHREFILKFRIQVYEMESQRVGDKLILKSLRTHLLIALKDFPKSNFFLECLLRHEDLVSSVSSIWHFILSSTSKSLSLLIFAVRVLIYKFKASVDSEYGTSGGYLNKAFNLLSRALEESRAARRCSALWRLLFWISHTLSSLGSRMDAHTLFYRSLQESPGSKVLYLDAVYYTICSCSESSPSECDDKLKSLLNLMAEKELRVQLPVEELDVLLEAEPDEEDLDL